jgi:anti-sigma B factor antagonist
MRCKRHRGEGSGVAPRIWKTVATNCFYRDGALAQKTLMEIEVEQIDEDALIKLSGRLDMNTSPDLRKTALTLFTKRKSKNLTIDFANASYIDTSGLATLVEILVTAKEQRAQLTLSGLNEKVRYLLDVNGLTGFFKISGSARERLHA